MLEYLVRVIVNRHGGVRRCARVTGIDKAYLSRMMNGSKVNPSEKVLQKLGLEKVMVYRFAATPLTDRTKCA